MIEKCNELDPKIWGPHYWFVLHTISLTYPDIPNETTKKKYYDLVDLNIKNINTINQNEIMLKTKTRIKKLSNKEKKYGTSSYRFT